VTTDASGRIVLKATDTLTLAENSLTQADEVNMRADREVLLEGRIDASNSQGPGGKIEVTGNSVALRNANIDASGGTQGGTVHLGGGWQGGGDLPHAREVTVGVGSEVKANGAGNGGEIVVWSTQSSDHYGLLEAKDGGQIELSSKGVIRHHGDIVAGPGGHVLFDPINLFILDSPPFDPSITSDPPLRVSILDISPLGSLPTAININGINDNPTIVPFDLNPSGDSYILSSWINDKLVIGTNVTLQAKNDILIQSEINPGINPDLGALGNLTFQAGHNIIFGDNIIIPGSNLTAIAGDTGALANLQDSNTPTLSISQGVTLEVATGTATLAAVNGDFINNNGNQAINTSNQDSDGTTSGQWLIYEDKPPDPPLGSTVDGFLVSSFNKHYNEPYIAGNTPSYASSGNWFLYSVAPVLQVAPAPNGQTITYGDASPVFNPDISSGFIGGDTVTTPGVISTGNAIWHIDGADITSDNPNAGTHDVVYTNGLVSDLGYQFADDSASNNELTVNKRLLTASGFSAQDKIYNATTEAQLVSNTGILPIGDVVANDDVSLSGVIGVFSDANAGINKVVTVSGQIEGADKDNYVLNILPTQATITQKKLTLIADPVTSLFGLQELTLGGDFSDDSLFVGNDTLENATTGSLQWITSATAESPPGTYSVIGEGLTATNYNFVQASSNATALTVLPAPPVPPVTPVRPGPPHWNQTTEQLTIDFFK